jgi:hypothetical protein
VGLIGDSRRLAALAKRCHNLPETFPAMTRKLATQAVELNRRSFAAGTSPEGVHWVEGPHLSKPPLKRSGALAASFRVASTPLSFSIRVGRRYGWYHQYGAVLRDSIVGSRGTLRTKTFGPGRKKEGPRRRVRQQGPLRKGRERGFLPARPIVPSGDVPRPWRPALEAVADRHFRSALNV